MSRFFLTLSAILCGFGFTPGLSPLAASQPADSYAILEIDRFIAAPGVAVPAPYPDTLADDIARELSVEIPTIMILHEGDPVVQGRPMLRISGTVTQFRPASPAKKSLPGFGPTAVTAQVRFADASTGRVLDIRQFQSAADSLGRKIARFCKGEKLVDSK